jgi:hypothetical protein
MTSVRLHGDLIDDRNPAATREASDFCAPTVSSFSSKALPHLPGQSGTGRCGASGLRASRRASRSSSTRTCVMPRMRSARWTVRNRNHMNTSLKGLQATQLLGMRLPMCSLLCMCLTSPQSSLQVCATGYQGWRVEFTRAGPRGSGPPGGGGGGYGGGGGGGYGMPQMGYGGPPPSYYGMRGGPARDQL